MFAVSSSRSLCRPSTNHPSRSTERSPRSFISFKRQGIASVSAVDMEKAGLSVPSMTIEPPFHPTYDLKTAIGLALAEDAGDRGDVTCLATIPADTEAEAHFIAKEDGVIAGIALAEIIFNEVDPSLEVEWLVKDGNYIQRGYQFGKVSGRARSIIVAERVVLNFMQRMSGIATLTKEFENM